MPERPLLCTLNPYCLTHGCSSPTVRDGTGVSRLYLPLLHGCNLCDWWRLLCVCVCLAERKCLACLAKLCLRTRLTHKGLSWRIPQ